MDRYRDVRVRPGPGARGGFTLLEILIVVVIIGVLASVVLPRFAGQSDRARASAARAEIASFKTALEMFRQDVGRYPTNAEGLEALVSRPAGADGWREMGYLDQEAAPTDPWGRPYAYTQPGAHGPFDIVCYGADGEAGGSDSDADIVSWDLKGNP